MMILKTASAIFAEKAKTDRADAFEHRAAYLMENAHILVGSRIVKLDQMESMLRETHAMIGKPIKRTEAGEAAPLDLMKEWLNESS